MQFRRTLLRNDQALQGEILRPICGRRRRHFCSNRQLLRLCQRVCGGQLGCRRLLLRCWNHFRSGRGEHREIDIFRNVWKNDINRRLDRGFIVKMRRNLGGREIQFRQEIQQLCCRLGLRRWNRRHFSQLSAFRCERHRLRRSVAQSHFWQIRHERMHRLGGLCLCLRRMRRRQGSANRICFCLSHARQRQWQTLTAQAHGIRCRPEGFRLPRAGLALGDGFNPRTEGVQRFCGERLHGDGHGLLLGKPGVEHLLHGPASFTKIRQPHHTGTTLERVECTAQRGLLTQVARGLFQRSQRRQPRSHHLACFLQEDVEQFVVFFLLGRGHGCWRQHGLRNRERGCFWRGSNWLGLQLHECILQLWRRRRLQERLWLYLHGGNKRRRRHGCGTGNHLGQRKFGTLLDFDRNILRAVSRTRPSAPHEHTQLALLLVVHEQLARHGALVAQHVDQEPQCPQAASQLFKKRLTFLLWHLIDQQTFDRFAHARHRKRCLVKPKHGENPAHLGQLSGHRREHRQLFWRTKELVETLFRFSQRRTQLVNDAPHGLAVTDPAVQILHPRLQRCRLGTSQDLLETLCQTACTLHHAGVTGIQIFERGLQIQHGSRNFHSQCGGWWLARTHCGLQGARQGPRKAVAPRQQLVQ